VHDLDSGGGAACGTQERSELRLRRNQRNHLVIPRSEATRDLLFKWVEKQIPSRSLP